MSRLRIRAASVIAIIVAVGIAAYFLLPTAHCCGGNSQEEAALTAAAAAGQLGAIRASFERARKDGVPALEEHWALQGALRGDEQLRKMYVEFYRTRFSEDRRRQVLAQISKENDLPGTACLASVLANPQASQACR